MIWMKTKSLQDARLAYIPTPLQSAGLYYADDSKKLDQTDAADISKIFDKSLAVVGIMNRMGLKFMAGTDTPFPPFPGFGLHEELKLMVQAGLTPLQALQAATLNPAVFLGRLTEFGTVEKNKVADLVLLDANPLKDIRSIEKIDAVVLNGKYLSRNELDRMLAETKAVAAKPEMQ